MDCPFSLPRSIPETPDLSRTYVLCTCTLSLSPVPLRIESRPSSVVRTVVLSVPRHTHIHIHTCIWARRCRMRKDSAHAMLLDRARPSTTNVQLARTAADAGRGVGAERLVCVCVREKEGSSLSEETTSKKSSLVRSRSRLFFPNLISPCEFKACNRQAGLAMPSALFCLSLSLSVPR